MPAIFGLAPFGRGRTLARYPERHWSCAEDPPREGPSRAQRRADEQRWRDEAPQRAAAAARRREERAARLPAEMAEMEREHRAELAAHPDGAGLDPARYRLLQFMSGQLPAAAAAAA